jgi:hypothetical protein
MPIWRGFLQSDFWWHHEAASEELALECFVSLLSYIQQRVEFRLISQSVQERIRCEIRMTEESTFNASTQYPECRGFVSQY